MLSLPRENILKIKVEDLSILSSLAKYIFSVVWENRTVDISAIFALVFALHLKSCRYRQKVGGKSCVIRLNLAVIRFDGLGCSIAVLLVHQPYTGLNELLVKANVIIEVYE